MVIAQIVITANGFSVVFQLLCARAHINNCCCCAANVKLRIITDTKRLVMQIEGGEIQFWLYDWISHAVNVNVTTNKQSNKCLEPQRIMSGQTNQIKITVITRADIYCLLAQMKNHSQSTHHGACSKRTSANCWPKYFKWTQKEKKNSHFLLNEFILSSLCFFNLLLATLKSIGRWECAKVRRRFRSNNHFICFVLFAIFLVKWNTNETKLGKLQQQFVRSLLR